MSTNALPYVHEIRARIEIDPENVTDPGTKEACDELDRRVRAKLDEVEWPAGLAGFVSVTTSIEGGARDYVDTTGTT